VRVRVCKLVRERARKRARETERQRQRRHKDRQRQTETDRGWAAARHGCTGGSEAHVLTSTCASIHAYNSSSLPPPLPPSIHPSFSVPPPRPLPSLSCETHMRAACIKKYGRIVHTKNGKQKMRLAASATAPSSTLKNILSLVIPRRKKKDAALACCQSHTLPYNPGRFISHSVPCMDSIEHRQQSC
jgi:hypothetical protein